MTITKTLSFRSAAIATLKQLRADGYELTIKLNASNEFLHAELLRLERLIENQEELLTCQLEDVNETRYAHAQSTGLADILETEVLNTMTDAQLIDEAHSLLDDADAKLTTLKANTANLKQGLEAFADDLEAWADDKQAEQAVRISQRATTTSNLLNHLGLLFNLIGLLSALLMSLPKAAVSDGLSHIKSKAFQYCPMTCKLLVVIGESLRGIKACAVMDKILCPGQ